MAYDHEFETMTRSDYGGNPLTDEERIPQSNDLGPLAAKYRAGLARLPWERKFVISLVNEFDAMEREIRNRARDSALIEAYENGFAAANRLRAKKSHTADSVGGAEPK